MSHPEELKSAKDSLSGLRSQRAYLGLTELIDWVELFTSDEAEANDFSAVQPFLKYIVMNKLYVEKFLELWQ